MSPFRQQVRTAGLPSSNLPCCCQSVSQSVSQSRISSTHWPDESVSSRMALQNPCRRQLSLKKQNNLLINEIFWKFGTSDPQLKNFQNSYGNDVNNKHVICLIVNVRVFLKDEKLGLLRGRWKHTDIVRSVYHLVIYM